MRTFATLAAVSVLALAGVAAQAQTPPPAAPQAQGATPAPDAAPPAPDRDRRGPRFSRADQQALVDARIAAIQAGLKLNADQQRLWGPVEQALRSQANQRITRMEERRAEMERRRAGGAQTSPAEPDLMERLDQRATRATESAEQLRTFAGAMKPFWASLDDNQKRLLPVLMRTAMGGERGRRWGGYDHRRGGPDRHHGGMMPGGYQRI